MELIHHKLTTLLELLILKEKEIVQQTKLYQTSQDRTLDAYISIKRLINQIIQYIAYTIIAAKGSLQNRIVPNLKVFYTKQQLSKMNLIKSNLQDIRGYFLRPTLQERVNLNQIKVQVKNLIISCDNYNSNRQNQPINEYSIFPSAVSHNHYQTNPNSIFTPTTQTQQQKKIRIKGYLYKQVNDHLIIRKNSFKQEQLIHKIENSSNNSIYGKLQYDEGQLRERSDRNRKKRFNYLEQCQKQIQKIQTNNPKQQYFTPNNMKQYKIIPSTQSNSAEHLEQHIEPFGIQISRIPQVKNREKDEEIIQIELKQFLEDSLQNEQNLDDSLQLMKKQQNLNKTGQFGTIPIQQQHLNQFSFSEISK